MNFKDKFKKNDWNENNLKSKVKSIITSKFKLIDKKEKIIKDNSIYFLDKKHKESFDLKGNKIYSKTYDSRDVRTVLIITNYDYNNLVTNYKYYDNENEIMFERLIKHLDNENIEEEWNGFKVINNYNYLEKSIITTHYEDDNNIAWKEIYKYDSKMNLIEFRNISVFDEIIFKYKNDSFGNTIEETEIDSTGKCLKKKKFHYSFDKHNNWVDKTEYLIENTKEIPQIKMEREIKYY